MSQFEQLQAKQHQSRTSLLQWLATAPRPLVFTNGCFDILHLGHITYLAQAADLGASLIVGVNSDASVRLQNKSDDRPINPIEDRLSLLAALQSVSAVIAYDDPTPLALINQVKPDVLVKGGDWAIDQIVGGDVVTSWGGQVVSMPFKVERSTTALLEKIRG